MWEKYFEMKEREGRIKGFQQKFELILEEDGTGEAEEEVVGGVANG